MKPRILSAARLSFTLASAIAALLSTQSIYAGTTWDGGGGGTTSINLASNWDGTAPGVVNALNGTTAAIFGTGGSTATINVAASFTGITINRDAPFTIADGVGALTVGTGGVTVTLPSTTARAHSISESSLILNGNQSWTVTNNTGAASLNVSSLISETGGARTLTKAGTGTLILSGASGNTYTGLTTISGGVLRITKNAALGTVAAGVTQSGTSALEIDGNSGDLTVGAEALTINGGGISNAGALRNIAGNNIYGGTVTMAAQSRINSDSGTLTLNNATASVTGAFTLVVGGAGNVTISTPMTNGVGGLNKADGAGTLTLSGLNTFTGGVSTSAGTLAVGVAGNGTNSALGSVVSTRTITVNTNSTVRFDVGNVFNNNFASAATSVPAFNIAGGTLTNGGTATNSALGNITLTGGTLSATLGSGTGYGSWNLNGTVTSTGTSTISSSAAVPVTLSAAAGTNTTFDVQSGTLTASAALGEVTATGDERVSGFTKIGAGTMVLSGTNTYTGNAAINVGTLNIATTGALPGYNVNGRYSVASGATLAVQNGVSDSEITAMLGTTNFLSGANLGFDTTAGSRSVPLNLADTANGPLGIVKLGANTLTLSGTNTYTGVTNVLAGGLNITSTNSLPGWNVNGGFSVASGASLVIPNGVSEAEVTTMLGTTNVASGASLLFDTSLGDRTYVSPVTNSNQGLLNIGKIGTNTLTLSGANTYTGTSTVSAGTLVLSGSTTTGGNLLVGNTTSNSVLNIPATGVMTAGTVSVGTTAASIGALNISGGSLSCATPESTDTISFGAGEGAYGAFNLSSGSFTQQRFMIGGVGSSVTGGTGVGLIMGGTVNSSGWVILARAGASTGTLTITGGTLNHSGAAQDISIGLGAGTATIHTGRAELNVAGGLLDNTGRRVTFGAGTTGGFHWAGTGVLNLNAGTLVTNSITYDTATSPYSPTSNSYVNFNGGLLKAASSSTTFLAVNTQVTTGINRVFVNGAFGTFSGGANIDTNGFNNTISANLLAPSGNGVTSLTIDSAGSGYIGAPSVKILDNGLPSTATAYAVVDTDSSSPNFGKLTSVVITNPGVITGTATVSLVGGGGSGAAVSVASTGANTSGGLTKSGAGTLTLSGANTYTGATAVNAGTLNLTGSLSGGGAITIGSNGLLDQSSTGVISGASTLTLSGTGTSTLAGTNSYAGATSLNAGTLNLTGSLTSNVTVANNANLGGEGSTTGSVTFSGTSDLGFDPSTIGTYLTAASVDGTGASVTVTPTVPVTGTGIVVLSAAGGITGTAGGVGNNFIYTGRGNLYFNGGNTQLLIDTAPVSLAWSGNDGTNPTFWNLNTTPNWDSGGSQNFFTGDAVTFDDTAASYTVDINAANVLPGNMTFNNTTTYTIQGAFGIYGGGTLTKNGSGTTVMNSPNGYTGATTVAAGVLNIRNANALGSILAGTSVTSGAALEIQGGITTAAEPLSINGTGISSNGALRNISGTNTFGGAVTLASASSIGIDAGTLIIPSLTGAFGLTKVGAGTLNVTGASAVTPVTVEAGTLYMGAQTGASITTTLGATSAVTLNGSSNLTIRRTNTGQVDFAGAIGGNGSLTLLGDNANTSQSGDFTMNDASTFTGGTTITGARALITTSGAALGTGTISTGANGQVFVSTTGLTVTNNLSVGGLGWNESAGYLGAIRLNTSTLQGNIALTSNARITGAGTNTLSGIISGAFDVDFFEDTVIGTISLSGNNTYTGTTIINSMGSGSTFPNLIVSHNNALGTTAGGTIVYGTGTTGTGSALTLATGITVTDETLTLDPTANSYRATLQTSGTATWDGNLVVAGTGGFLQLYSNTGGNLIIGSNDSDTVTGTNTLVVRGVGNGTINSALNMTTGGILKTDGGTWTITSNNNSFTGIPAAAGGILSVGSIANSGINSALGAGTSITLGQNSTATGTLQFTGAGGGSSDRALLINNGATGGAGAIENTVAGQTLTLSGALTVATPASACSLTLAGAGDGVLSQGIAGAPALALIKTGAGTWTLPGVNTYTGTTTINNGTLAFTTSSSLTGGLVIGSAAANTTPGILDLTSANATFGGALLMNTNSATASEIKIGAARTLTFNGNVQIGATTPVTALNAVSRINMTGGGTFNVTTAAAGTFIVGGSTLTSTSTSQDSTVDLTALSSTAINTSTTGTIRVSAGSPSNVAGYKSTLLLPTPVVADTVATATLTAGTIGVGVGSGFNSSPGQINTLQLGTGLNTLNANTINVGTGGRDIGQMIFAGAGGDVIIRAADGSSRATTLAVGAGGGGTATSEPTTNNLVDFSGHDADILVTSLNVGNQPRTGALISEFKFGAGTGSIANVLDATNVNIGFRTGTGGSSQALTNRVNLSGGTVTFGNVGATGTGVDIGSSAYTGGGTASTIGELNISGGTVTVYNGTQGFAVRLGSNSAAAGGTVTASMNLTGGTTTLGGDIVRGIATGTVTSTLNISGGTLDMGGFNIGTLASAITLTAESGTLSNVATINGTGGLTKTTAGTLTLAGTNTYTGNTVVNAGTLALADNAQIKFVTGATSGTNNSVTGAGTFTIDGDFNIDTTLTDASVLTTGSWTLVDAATLTETFNPSFTLIGAGWSESANVWTKTVGAKKYTFAEATGILTLSPSASYASWIDGFFPGETDPAIIGAAADPDNDGIENGVEMVIGGNPATGMDTALMPTLELVNADPDGDTTFADYLLFTYRRTDLSVTAGVTANCETDTDLVAPWTLATGAPGVVILTDDNYASFTPPAADTDRVRVYVPRGANTTLFGRLNVLVP